MYPELIFAYYSAWQGLCTVCLSSLKLFVLQFIMPFQCDKGLHIAHFLISTQICVDKQAHLHLVQQ